MARKTIYEILDELRWVKTDLERKIILLNNDSSALQAVLQGAFHPNIKFFTNKFPDRYIPQEIPPEMGYSRFETEIKRLYLFIEGHPKCPPLSKERKEDLLLQFLEGIEHKEAEVIRDMFCKDLKVPGLTRELVKETFPQLDV